MQTDNSPLLVAYSDELDGRVFIVLLPAAVDDAAGVFLLLALLVVVVAAASTTSTPSVATAFGHHPQQVFGSVRRVPAPIEILDAFQEQAPLRIIL